MTYQKLKQKVFKIISTDDTNYLPSKIFDIIIIILIILSLLSVIASTFDTLPDSLYQLFTAFERITLIVFSIEYLLRIWSADLLYPEEGKIKSRFSYIFSPMAIIDLLAILPFYLYFMHIDLVALRMFRIFRTLRVFKLNRYTSALYDITGVIKNKKDQLVSSIFVIAILMITASILMYYLEHDAQPTVFSNAFSGLWWAISTLTTIGYGDIYPITAMGKVLSSVIALLGIALIAIPTGIITSGFSEGQAQQKKSSALPYEELKQLKELLDEDIITQEEFDAKKKELLNEKQ